MHVMCVAGARPNFMKIKPVLDALEERSVECTFVHTGQHYDDKLSVIFFDELGLRAPDVDLGVGSGSHAEQTAGVMTALEPIVAERRPDAMVVVGDVNSTLAAALVSAKAGVVLGHVEAGLRSRDWSMPEEINRVVTDHVSDLLFATSADAVDNLRSEGIDGAKIHLVGNTMIDSLDANLERARGRKPWAEFGLDPGEYGLVTLHRPANVDDRTILAGLVDALEKIAVDLPLIFPVHPRTKAQLGDVDTTRVHVTAPLGYLDFLGLESAAKLVITDSGGIQEETTVLGIPCLTVRENTERPITVTQGTNRVVGLDPGVLVDAARRAMTEESHPSRPDLWDGSSGARIADILVAAAGERSS